MTNELTLETADNLTDAQLLACLASALSGAAESIRQGCIAVHVLTRRGVNLPALPEVFRYAADVAEGRLSARAGMTLARYPFAVKSVIGLPQDMQERLADGDPVKIAVKVNGRIQSAERTIWEMSQMQLRIAFTDGQITPWEQQGEWLLKSGFTEPTIGPRRVRFKVDAERQETKITTTGIMTLDDHRAALLAMGYQVTEIYKGKRLPAVKQTA